MWKAYCPKLEFAVDLDFRFAGQRRYSVEMKRLSAETVGKDKKLFICAQFKTIPSVNMVKDRGLGFSAAPVTQTCGRKWMDGLKITR